MLIPYFKCVGYLLAANTGIKSIEWTITQPLSVIMGTNGCGKSSLLKILNARTPDSKYFAKNGSREIHIQHNGSTYEIKNEYVTQSGRHTFIKDGVPLNDAGTTTVQTQLVIKYFGYTELLHKISISAKGFRFTDMSPNLRKDMLMTICGVDFSHAMSIYDAVRTLHRDQIGILKHIREKVERWSLRASQIEDTRQLESIQKDLQSLVPKLMAASNPSTPIPATIQTQLNGILSDIEQEVEYAQVAMRRFQRQHAAYTGGHIAGPTGIEIEWNERQEQYARIQGEIANTKKQLTEFESVQAVVGSGQLEDKLTVLKASLKDVTARLSDVPPHADPNNQYSEDAVSRFRATYHTVQMQLQTLFTNRDITIETFDRAQKDEIEAANAHATDRVAVLQSQIRVEQHRLDHALAAKESDPTCPKCATQIHSAHGQPDSVIAQWRAQLKEKEDALATQRATLEATTERMGALATYIEYRTAVVGIFQSNRSVINDMHDLGGPAGICGNPLHAIERIRQLHQLHGHIHTRVVGEREQKHLTDQIAMLESTLESGIMERFNKTREHLADLHTESSNATRRCNEIEKLQESFTSLLKHYDTITQYKDEWFNTVDTLIDANVWTQANGLLADTTNKLSTVTATIAESDNLTNRLTEMQAEETDATQEKAALDVLLKSISPKHGLIGKQLRLMMFQFCDIVNAYIREVWETQLELIPPNPDKAMDFKFDVVINGNPPTTVGEMSVGQSEMVDLAVMLAVRHYTGLQGSPLIMDETGVNFDPAHRRKLIDFMKRITESDQYGQLFVVCHFISEFGGLTNADMVVIDDANVTVPKRYNENIAIK